MFLLQIENYRQSIKGSRQHRWWKIKIFALMLHETNYKVFKCSSRKENNKFKLKVSLKVRCKPCNNKSYLIPYRWKFPIQDPLQIKYQNSSDCMKAFPYLFKTLCCKSGSFSDVQVSDIKCDKNDSSGSCFSFVNNLCF